MQTTNQPTFERNTFKKRLTTMLKVDFRRMFTSPFAYIMLGISLVHHTDSVSETDSMSAVVQDSEQN